MSRTIDVLLKTKTGRAQKLRDHIMYTMLRCGCCLERLTSDRKTGPKRGPRFHHNAPPASRFLRNLGLLHRRCRLRALRSRHTSNIQTEPDIHLTTRQMQDTLWNKIYIVLRHGATQPLLKKRVSPESYLSQTVINQQHMC